ncbi:hypothetical protein [Lysinibacillus pakistanensis]|uniref:hypothetical protein n=1 Tax=Lysinibacillus pakistanensis TaxID=759811 RepID=UPI003D2871EF
MKLMMLKGKLVDYLHPTSLEVNVPIDTKRFTPNLDDYKKEELWNGPKIITGNIDEYIPEELKEQWRKLRRSQTKQLFYIKMIHGISMRKRDT